MKSPNLLRMNGVLRESVQRFNGIGIFYSHRRRKLPAGEHREELNLILETEAPDAEDEYDMPSNCVIGLAWVDDDFHPDSLVGTVVEIPKSYDESIDDHVTDFYFHEHLEFDDVRIAFVERAGNQFRVVITGSSPDPSGQHDDRLEIHMDSLVSLTEFTANPPRGLSV